VNKNDNNFQFKEKKRNNENSSVSIYGTKNRSGRVEGKKAEIGFYETKK